MVYYSIKLKKRSKKQEHDESTSKPVQASLNQDCSLLCVSRSDGFSIYNIDPFREVFRRKLLSGGLNKITLLFRSSLVAMIGGGATLAAYPEHTVVFWDDSHLTVRGQLTFSSPVLSVSMRRDSIAVVLTNLIYIYNTDLNLIDQIDTAPNPSGIVSLSYGPDSFVLAYPAPKQGEVGIKRYGEDGTCTDEETIVAHKTGIAALSLSSNGSLLASTSTHGTVIRVFTLAPGRSHPEAILRRGRDATVIRSISFSSDNRMVLVGSDKADVALFDLADPKQSGKKEKKPTMRMKLPQGKDAGGSIAGFTAGRGDVLAVCGSGEVVLGRRRGGKLEVSGRWDLFLDPPK
eukprot:gnl/Dysnectes_brevis/6849_a10937_282.p1 GENE.gnl/Dysnectes_brevis/6849_a10937_282~~gnl/Dysnectes_brevis/6849_a10937_282.p1  ORF type:complete len:346 (+),score=71.96 gnl/Dysnectes_brevis/6849_a10937_282:48-1085(+)